MVRSAALAARLEPCRREGCTVLRDATQVGRTDLGGSSGRGQSATRFCRLRGSSTALLRLHLPHLCSTAGDVLYSSMKSNELSLRWVKVTSLMRIRFPGMVHSSCIEKAF